MLAEPVQLNVTLLDRDGLGYNESLRDIFTSYRNQFAASVARADAAAVPADLTALQSSGPGRFLLELQLQQALKNEHDAERAADEASRSAQTSPTKVAEP